MLGDRKVQYYNVRPRFIVVKLTPVPQHHMFFMVTFFYQGSCKTMGVVKVQRKTGWPCLIDLYFTPVPQHSITESSVISDILCPMWVWCGAVVCSVSNMRLLAVLLAVVCSSCSSSVGRSKSSGRSSGSSIFSGQSLSRFTPTRRASTSALNISLYCDTSTVTGYWRYGANESTDVSACKSDSGKFGKHKAAAYKQMTNYACPSYRSATYVPTSNCSLLSTSESLNILKYSMNPGAIVFVGDSLMMQQVGPSNALWSHIPYLSVCIFCQSTPAQLRIKMLLQYCSFLFLYHQYIAAQCDLNDLSTARSFSLHYNFDQYLRPNIPCEAICLQNATFRLSVRKKFPDPCSGCPEGRLISSTPPHYSSYKMNTQEGVWWMHRLPTDTRVLVISTGAWWVLFVYAYCCWCWRLLCLGWRWLWL